MDKKYINRTVTNKKHDKGIITNIVDNDITVKFDKEYICYNFKFPAAFKDATLTTTDPDLISYFTNYSETSTPADALGRRMRFGRIPVVFFNIAWMKWYDGGSNGDTPKNGGSFIDINHTGNEIRNFSPILVDSFENDKRYAGCECLFGSYETKSFNETTRQTRIERISGCQGLKNEGYANNVLVIWCATAPNGGRKVVGWYKDATVCRYYEDLEVERDDGNFNVHSYNVYAKAENAVLLSEKERFNAKWSVPGYTRKGDTTFGFGQSNVWYASEPGAEEYVKELVNNIDAYAGPSFIEAYEKRKGRR